MAFRGPDAQRIWTNGRVGFGHALLSTTFESEHELQPCSLDGRVTITADARVDGRAELIRKLRANDRELSDNAPDVELILHAYHVWGDECVQHLIGDFAFAIWDGHQHRLFCARDQFGGVPFYYAQAAHHLVLGNTLSCIGLHPSVSDSLNEKAIGDVLLFGMNHDVSTTTFRDIQCLPPAHTLTFANGHFHCQRYWAMPTDMQVQYRPADDIVAGFRELFEQAVADRLRNDRFAVIMSGGMDSTSVAVTARRLLAAQGTPFDLRAYTITWDHLMPDEERLYAGLVAEAAGIPIHYVMPPQHTTPHAAA